eukprot:9448022-Pyramimonas_sp.AAC.1
MVKNGVAIDISDVVTAASIEGRDRNTFGSRAYGRAKTQATSAGLSGKVVGEIAKWGFGVATEVWDSS